MDERSREISEPLTGVERDFAEQDPSGGKVQLQFEETSQALVELDGDGAGVFQHQVGHVREIDGFPVEQISRHAEVRFCPGEYLEKARGARRYAGYIAGG